MPSTPRPPQPPDDQPLPDWEGQTTVNLDDAEPAAAPDPLTPDERDQQPASQAPDAGQDSTPEARSAWQDAELNLPDTSAPPQLQQPSPDD